MRWILTRWRRRDYLTELQSLLYAALGVSAVVAVINVWAMVTREPITVAVGAGVTVRPDAVTGLLPGVRLDPGSDVQVLVDHPSAGQVAWHAAQSLPWFVLAVFTLVMLLLVVRAARRGDPFAAANVRRLRLVGWVLFLGSLLAFYAELWAGLALSTTVVADPPNTGADVPLVWCFCGFGFLALAEIINRGRALQAELAEVI
ncbi:DUF2975 domain-containing protein [Dactylosporangium sp. NPDC049525]|uniref:DUF2975 domain-containing protein n=1 Tax=Dactylosporangium sp. NPDC049525 TaxID=3154730 RepID=UPI00342BAF93